MSFGEDITALVERSSEPRLAKAEAWERVALGEIATILNGFAWKSEWFGSSGVPLIRIRDVTTGSTNTRYDGPITEGYWVERGDFLVGMDGDFNVRRWTVDRGLLNQRVCKITTLPDAYSTQFLEYVLPAYLKLINDMTSSVTVKHLSSRTLLDVPLPLPPLVEQHRIVAKLDALSARLARARAELDRVPVLADKLRRGCLNSVFSKASFAAWDRRTFNEVITEGLIGLIRSKAEQGTSGAPYLRMGHYGLDGRFNENDLTSVQCSPNELRHFQLREGDVLFNTRNSVELVGKVALWPAERPGWVFNNNILRLRFNADVLPGFVFRYMMSPIFRALMADKKSATTSVAAIYQRSLYAAPIPVPGIDRQREIISFIESTFARADRLEAEAARARKLIDRLEAAILAKAFRGELVPQDPDDEPASVLLERIRATRAAAPKPKRGRRAKEATDA